MLKNVFYILLVIYLIPFIAHSKANDLLLNAMTTKANNSASTAILEIQTELHNKENTNETRLLLQLILAQAFINDGDLNKAQEIAKKTAIEANSLQLKYVEGRSIYHLANVIFSQGKYSQAFELYQEAQHLFEMQNEQAFNAYALKSIGTVHTELGNLQDALEYYDRALQLMLLLNDYQGLAQVYNATGATYYYLKNYNKAIEYYTYSLNAAKKTNNPSLMITAYSNISEAYAENNNIEQAITYINSAIKLSESSSSLQSKIYSLLILGKLEIKRGNLQQAKKHFGTVLTLSKETNFKSLEIEALINFSELLSNKEEALNYAFTALKKSENIGKKAFIRDASEIISTLYLSQGDFEQAYAFLKKYHAINADIIKSINTDSLTKLSNSLATSKANHEIEMLKQKDLLNKAYIEEQKYFQALWILVIVIACIIIITSYRRHLLKQQTSLLKDTVTERTQHIIKIGEIGKKITSLIEIKKVVEVLSSQSHALFSADLFGLGIINKEQNALVFPFTVDKDQIIPEYQLSMTDIEQPAIICTVNNKELNFSQKSINSENNLSHFNNNMMSVAYLPLVIEDNAIGCITIQKEAEGGFTEYDMSILRSIASYISVAVVNSMTLSNVKSVAYTDYLTQLPNRRSFIESYHSSIALNKRGAEQLCIAITDIDKFKLFNDQYGHDGGDFVLKEVSKLMKNSLREQDVVARWGGEEFVFLLPNTDINGALTVLNNIREKLASKVYTFNQQKFSVTATFGVTTHDQKLTLDELIAKADQALYSGKTSGRNRVVSYHDI